MGSLQNFELQPLDKFWKICEKICEKQGKNFKKLEKTLKNVSIRYSISKKIELLFQSHSSHMKSMKMFSLKLNSASLNPFCRPVKFLSLNLNFCKLVKFFSLNLNFAALNPFCKVMKMFGLKLNSAALNPFCTAMKIFNLKLNSAALNPFCTIMKMFSLKLNSAALNPFVRL